MVLLDFLFLYCLKQLYILLLFVFIGNNWCSLYIFNCNTQNDLKRVIAYASVAHMNMILLGLFSLNIQGLEGSIFQMISHGIVSSALFLCVGVIYDRHHTRLIKYYSGLVHTMPLFISIFLLFMFANAALPGTCNFIGEFLILTGIFR